MDQMVILNPMYVADSLARQELKRWWVAEAVGVHKTTLRRWLQGSIARIRADRVFRLAEVLGEPYERLVDSSNSGDVPPMAEKAPIGCNRQYDTRKIAPSRRAGNDTDQGKLAAILPPVPAED